MTEQNYTFNLPSGLKDRIQQYLTDKGLFQIAKKTGQPTKDSINLLYKYLFIPHIIIEDMKTNRGIYEKEGFQLNTKVIKDDFFCISSKALKSIIDYLQENEIIILYSSEINYGKGSKDNKCRCYKLHPDLENSIEFYQCDTNSTFIQKLIKGDCFNKHIKQDTAPYTENELSIVQHQKSMFKNYIGFSEELIQYYTGFYNCSYEDLKGGNVSVKTSHLPIISLIRGEANVSRPDELSRVYSPITSLKKEYKPHLTLDGQELIGLDIVNSQLLFSVIALQEYEKVNNLNFTNNSDFQFYKECCQKGLVYETLAKQTELTEMLEKDRKKFKQLLYQRFFFSKVSKHPNKVQLGFKELFPTVYGIINEIKTEKKYNEWALMLQRVESQIVIDCAVSQLIDGGMKILTLHDGLYVSNEQDYQTAKSKLEECFKACGITANIKRELLVKTDLSILDKKSENELWFEDIIGEELNNHWFEIEGVTFNIKKLSRKEKDKQSKKLSKRQFIELFISQLKKENMNAKKKARIQKNIELINRIKTKLHTGQYEIKPKPTPLTEMEEKQYEAFLIEKAEEEDVIKEMSYHELEQIKEVETVPIRIIAPNLESNLTKGGHKRLNLETIKGQFILSQIEKVKELTGVQLDLNELDYTGVIRYNEKYEFAFGDYNLGIHHIPTRHIVSYVGRGLPPIEQFYQDITSILKGETIAA